ncbi:hypothetical protein L596_021741 [Steinernema carpocapsae]|uniref:Uncharacterized protein n=1 Tax=Steinernema carpocapsae TaxID=34508 RepID=A0A4U5MJR2_STECR|nr:hypothetical protein L596_021741 [Steinernema carpocapsae]
MLQDVRKIWSLQICIFKSDKAHSCESYVDHTLVIVVVLQSDHYRINSSTAKLQKLYLKAQRSALQETSSRDRCDR